MGKTNKSKGLCRSIFSSQKTPLRKPQTLKNRLQIALFHKSQRNSQTRHHPKPFPPRAFSIITPTRRPRTTPSRAPTRCAAASSWAKPRRWRGEASKQCFAVAFGQKKHQGKRRKRKNRLQKVSPDLGKLLLRRWPILVWWKIGYLGSRPLSWALCLWGFCITDLDKNDISAHILKRFLEAQHVILLHR